MADPGDDTDPDKARQDPIWRVYLDQPTYDLEAQLANGGMSPWLAAVVKRELANRAARAGSSSPGSSSLWLVALVAGLVILSDR